MKMLKVEDDGIADHHWCRMIAEEGVEAIAGERLAHAQQYC